VLQRIDLDENKDLSETSGDTLKRQAILSKQIGAVNATWLRTHPLPRVVLTCPTVLQRIGLDEDKGPF
jgi:hypothetical protein